MATVLGTFYRPPYTHQPAWADRAEKHNFGKDIELGEAEIDVCLLPQQPVGDDVR